MRCKKTLKEFIEESNIIHNHKYDYSKVSYVNNKTKVCIICPIHGEFKQTPIDHIKGKGCNKCKGGVRDTTESFIEKAKKIHGDKYDYSNVEYINSHTRVNIICPKHGEFSQIPNNHLNGNGCKICRSEKMKHILSFDKEQFVTKSNVIHNNKYDYTKVNYVNVKTLIDIICPIHGVFQQNPENHLQGSGCQKCCNVKSSPEDEIIETLRPLECEQGNRKILDGKEIDVYVPSLKIGVEYNGLLWHSEAYGKDKYYHLNKLEECERKRVKLIQIFEDEWINHRDICEYKLKQLCGVNVGVEIDEEKCVIRSDINKTEVNNFCEKYGFCGKDKFSVSVGCYYCDKLVYIATFRKIKNNSYLLNNIAFNTHYNCDKLLYKIVTYFIEHYNFNELKLLADRRWVGNCYDNVYTECGFKLSKFISPSFKYYNQAIKQFARFSKYQINKLKKAHFSSKNVDKYETKVWDCGKIEYVLWKNGSNIV